MASEDPKRTLFGNVAGDDYDRLLEQHRALSTRFEAEQDRIAALEKAEQARQARIHDAIGDAEAVLTGLDSAATELASLVLPAPPAIAPSDLELATRRLFPRLLAGLDIGHAEDEECERIARLRDAPDGRTSWESSTLTDAGERSLEASAALVNETVVTARYASGVFPEGGVPGTVESFCHALAASLAARERARLAALERGHVTLLGNEIGLLRLRALREAQGDNLAEVSLELGQRLRLEQEGLYGQKAWGATVFDCAGRLDTLARTKGGEAFEIGGTLTCLVPEAVVTEAAECVRAIAVELGLPDTVAVG